MKRTKSSSTSGFVACVEQSVPFFFTMALFPCLAFPTPGTVGVVHAVALFGRALAASLCDPSCSHSILTFRVNCVMHATHPKKKEAALLPMLPLHPCCCDESRVERICVQHPLFCKVFLRFLNFLSNMGRVLPNSCAAVIPVGTIGRSSIQ